MVKKWEYWVTDLSKFWRTEQEIEQEKQFFDSCGENGWELVAVTETSTYSGEYKRKAYFKREKV